MAQLPVRKGFPRLRGHSREPPRSLQGKGACLGRQKAQAFRLKTRERIPRQPKAQGNPPVLPNGFCFDPALPMEFCPKAPGLRRQRPLAPHGAAEGLT